MQVRLFRAKAFPISSRLDSVAEGEGDGTRRASSRKRSNASQHTQQPEDSQTSGEETEPEHSMTFIRRPRSDCGQEGQIKGEAETEALFVQNNKLRADGVAFFQNP